MIDVYEHEKSREILFQLMSERSAEVNISHREVPSWADHCAFIYDQPYAAWYIVEDEVPVGAVYLTRQNEIGIGILQEFSTRGYAKTAIRMLMEAHPRPKYLANINPRNSRSMLLFEGLGFAHIQNTLCLTS